MNPTTMQLLIATIASLTGFSEEEIKEDTTFKDLDMDSLDFVELTMEVEKDFNIVIPDCELDDVKTVKDFELLIIKTRGNE